MMFHIEGDVIQIDDVDKETVSGHENDAIRHTNWGHPRIGMYFLVLKIEEKFELLKEKEMSKIILDLFSNKEKFEKIGDQDPIGGKNGNISRQTTIVHKATNKVFLTFQI